MLFPRAFKHLSIVCIVTQAPTLLHVPSIPRKSRNDSGIKSPLLRVSEEAAQDPAPLPSAVIAVQRLWSGQ